MPRYREGMNIRDFPGNELLSKEDTVEGTITLKTLADIETELANFALDKVVERFAVEDTNGPRIVSVTVKVESWNEAHGGQSNG